MGDASCFPEVVVVEAEPQGLGSCSERISMGGILQWQLNIVDYVVSGFASMSCHRISVLAEIAKLNCFRLVKNIFSTRSHVSYTNNTAKKGEKYIKCTIKNIRQFQ